MKKRTSKLEGSVIDLMRRLGKDKSTLHDYFYWDSDLWHAIQDHIWHAKECCLIEKPTDEKGEPLSVAVARGHGGMVNWKGAHTYPTQYREKKGSFGSEAYEVDYFNLDFTVTYEDEDEEKVRAYHLQIPFDLEDNFTKEKFASWLETKREELRLSKEQKQLPLLKKLIDLYPTEAREMLGG